MHPENYPSRLRYHNFNLESWRRKEEGILHLSYIQVPDNRMVRVDLKHPSAPHEFQTGCITHRLCLHQPAVSLITYWTMHSNFQNTSFNIKEKRWQPFHVCRPTKFSRHQDTRWRAKPVWNLHTCNFISQSFLDPVTRLAKFLLHFLFLFLILITCRKNKLYVTNLNIKQEPSYKFTPLSTLKLARKRD